MSQIPISHRSLKELFGDSLTSSLCVNIEKGTETWVATGMLVQQLESFTDAVVVRENEKPIGIVGGKDIIGPLAKNPNADLFYNTKVEDIMEKRFPTISSESRLEELMDFWKSTRRAFAAIPNEFSDYSAVSAKKMLEVGKKCKSNVSISEMPEKKLITFSGDSTVGKILEIMLEKNIRRLMLEDSNKFINDRIILQKITDELKYLKNIESFWDLPISDFKLEEASSVSSEIKIQELSEIMYKMEHPCIISDGRIITPWDICLILLSDKLIEYEN